MMKFNYRTMQSLRDCGAILTKSCYEITSIDFHGLKAFVNKVDTFKKRNGKIVKMEHHFGKWIPFPKDMIGHSTGTTIEYVNSIYASESSDTYQKTVKSKFLSNANKQLIISKYNTSI